MQVVKLATTVERLKCCMTGLSSKVNHVYGVMKRGQVRATMKHGAASSLSSDTDSAKDGPEPVGDFRYRSVSTGLDVTAFLACEDNSIHRGSKFFFFYRKLE
jgi:hypothetical protein